MLLPKRRKKTRQEKARVRAMQKQLEWLRETWERAGRGKRPKRRMPRPI